MKKLITTLSMVLVLAGCSSEDQSATSESLKKAGEQANVGRFEEMPSKDATLPQTSGDTQELKETLSTAKDRVIEKGGEVIDKAKDAATKQTD